MSSLPAYKADLVRAAIDGGALKFGNFQLKSKRWSPYFFNTGEFHKGRLAKALDTAFAKTIDEAERDGTLKFDIVFGPAYKGITLCKGTTDALTTLDEAKYGDVSWAHDRKEAKDHGEGGTFVGAPLKGRRVLIVDDVVTAGTAKREAIDKIRGQGGVVAGIVVVLDRKEKLSSPDGDDSKPMPSAIGELRKEYGIPILAVLTVDDIIEGVKGIVLEDDIKKAEEYQAKYAPSD